MGNSLLWNYYVAKAGVLGVSNIHGHILQKRREVSLSAASGLLILFLVGHGA